ncbi:hypothetical protein BH23ACT7_BH23ACT7_02070 [soil metagenome]
MTTKIEKSIEVNVPVSTAYNQWTQFEDFPQFMGGVEEVTQLDDERLHWVAEIAGVRREWDAVIVTQVPDERIAWAATEGATNAGAVYFAPLGAGQKTLVRLSLEYEPEGLVEQVGDKLSIVEKRAEADLEKFKEFIENRGAETGTWRGSVDEDAPIGTPGVEAAQSSQGDSGKAGVSAKAVVAGAAAAAGVAAAGALAGRSGSDSDERSPSDLPPPPQTGPLVDTPPPVAAEPIVEPTLEPTTEDLDDLPDPAVAPPTGYDSAAVPGAIDGSTDDLDDDGDQGGRAL